MPSSFGVSRTLTMLRVPPYEGSQLAQAFTPLSLSPERWFAATSITAGDGDPIATWTDLSGNGHNATQASASSQPAYTVDAIGSLPAILFDGVDDFMVTASTPNGMVEATIFIVFNPLITSQQQIFIEWEGSNVFHFWMNSSSNKAECFYFFSEPQQAGSWATGWQLGMARYDAAPVYRKNGVAGTTVSNTGNLPNPATGIGIGVKVDAGGAPANPDPFVGYMAEILVFPRALTDLEVTSVETYLNHKYSLF